MSRVIFLRDQKGGNICEAEITDKDSVDLHVSVDLPGYSKLLLAQKGTPAILQVIRDFNEVSELRGWLHEVYFGTGRDNTPSEYQGVLKEVKEHFNMLAEKYSLQVWED